MKKSTIRVRELANGRWSVMGAWFPTVHFASDTKALRIAEAMAARVQGTRIIVRKQDGSMACKGGAA